MRSLLQNIKYKGKIKVGYISAFLLLLLSFLLTYYTNQRLFKNAEIIDHTNRVIANLEYMLSEIKDGEIGSRGYVATGNEFYLDPYYGSQKRTDSVFRVVENLITDPGQLQTLHAIKNKIIIKYKFIYQNLISFNKNKGVLTPALMDSFKQGKLVMDEIRDDINLMQAREKKLLLQRNQNLNKTNDALSSIVIASIIIAFFLVVFGFSTHIRENFERTLADEKLKLNEDELKKRIEELAKANTQLVQMRREEKFASTGRIARTIAHEIRNPLTNINLAAEQLSSEMPPETIENTGFLFDMITRNSNRINLLISDLLNSTKFSELNFQKVSINDLLDDTLQQAADRMQLNNVRIIKNYGNDICDITVDKEKIKIAFLNIIINAIEAMEGKQPAEFTIETKKEANQCIVIISDTGIGMDEEAVSKLFEPYFTNKPKGNGLGLTNTQNIILNHKGNISVKSKVGKGTSFTIILNNE